MLLHVIVLLLYCSYIANSQFTRKSLVLIVKLLVATVWQALSIKTDCCCCKSASFLTSLNLKAFLWGTLMMADWTYLLNWRAMCTVINFDEVSLLTTLLWTNVMTYSIKMNWEGFSSQKFAMKPFKIPFLSTVQIWWSHLEKDLNFIFYCDWYL